MTQDEIQELRDWSARKIGCKIILENIMGIEIIGGGFEEYVFPNGDMILVCDWTPDTDRNQCFMVKQKMIELGYDYYESLYRDGDGNSCHFYKDDDNQGFRSGFKPDELAENILKAARATEE